MPAGSTRDVCAAIDGITPSPPTACAGMAALQGGHAGAHPHQDYARTAAGPRPHLALNKAATSPANSVGS